MTDLALRRDTPLWVVVTAVAVPLVVCATLAGLREGLSDPLPDTATVLALVLVVVAVASLGHRLGGVLAAASAAVCFDFFLTQPYYRLTIAERDDIVTAVLLLLVGVSVTELALWGRRQQSGSSRREGYLDGVVSAARMAAAGGEPSAVMTFVADQIADLLGVDTVTYRAARPGDRPRLEADGDVTRGGRRLDVDRHGLPTDDEVEILVHDRGRVVGVFVVVSATHVAWPSAEARRVAVTLAEQAGTAFARSGPDK